ncbi:PiggyBac transposable element-derived protein 3 [Araneus ventricosus]|uniref:PiggyBac transposable element-derived protein 3 n=1 Tax=Araneus ventricosus TaxID=182803 RepID=A0A4Y2J9L3_ARAVE|nr:PiggyBac transposable element-derived protein 3 [Araneus ventricosus]
MDVQRYIGICYLMSIIHLSSARDYWSDNLGNQTIKETLSVKEFEKIRQFLHFNDNTKEIPRGMNDHDRLFKVRPLIESIRKHFMQVTMEECLSIDEQICATQSRSILKQYMPKKPHKWGFKFFVSCGVSGFAYDFELYSGQENGAIRPPNEPDLGCASNVVVRLSRLIPQNQNHKLFFDNHFNSLPLLEFLSQNGILPLGTVRRNRIPDCKLPLESEMKKEKRGYSLEQVSCINSTEISCVTWLDNKPVHFLSTFVGSLPIENISRFDKKLHKKTDIPCPFVVKQYNKPMGGVDLLDSHLRRYRNKMRSKKEEVAICLCKIGSETPNAKRGRPSMFEVEMGIIAKKHKGPVTAMPVKDVGLDGVCHWSEYMENRQRRERPNCTRKTFIKCSKCGVALCINRDRNCYSEFHQK